jgi:hypothetical protein
VLEFSASGWSLIQGSPTECGVFECVHEASINEEALAHKGLFSWGGESNNMMITRT